MKKHYKERNINFFMPTLFVCTLLCIHTHLQPAEEGHVDTSTVHSAAGDSAAEPASHAPHLAARHPQAGHPSSTPHSTSPSAGTTVSFGPSAPADTHTQTPTTAATTVAFDLEQFHHDIKKVRAARRHQDHLISQQQSFEDQSAQQQRDSQGFFTRIIRKSSDGATDAEIQKKRNDEAMQRNAQRIAEDFEMQKQRFESFKQKYPEFSAKPPFDTLLEFGDMNSFINGAKDARDALIAKLESALKNLDKNSIQTAQDLQAAHDFAELLDLSLEHENSRPRLIPAQAEFNALSEQERSNVIQELQNTLTTSLNSSLANLKKFNEQLELVKNDIASVRKIRTIKNISDTVAVIAGFATAATMIAGPARQLVIHGIALTMEKFAIAAKVGFIAGHSAADAESRLALQAQQNMIKTFQTLMPKSFDMVEAQAYKNKAKTIKQRLAETSVGKAVTSVARTLKPVTDAAATVAQKISDHITQTSVYQVVAQKASDVATTIKSSLPKPKPVDESSDEYQEFSLARKEFAKAPAELTAPAIDEQDDEHTPPKITDQNRIELMAQHVADQATQQQADDAILKKYTQDTAKFAAKNRDRQGTATRLLNTLISDSDSDTEQQRAAQEAAYQRNIHALRQRWDYQKKQFEAFAETHADFAAKEPWKTILEMGDVTTFVESYDFNKRTEMINDLDTIINNLDDMTISAEDQAAAYELVRLTAFAQTSALPVDFIQPLTRNIENMSDTERADLVKKIKEQLIQSLEDTIPKLQAFRAGYHGTLQDAYDTQEKLKTLENIGNGIAVVMGIAAIATIISGPVGSLVIAGIKLTVEKLAIIGKSGYLIGALTGMGRDAFAQKTQESLIAIFEPLMPSGFTFSKPEAYIDSSRNIAQRIVGDKVYTGVAKAATAVKDKITGTKKPAASAPPAAAAAA